MTTHLIYLIFTFHLVLCLGCVAPPSTPINSMPKVATTALSSATSIELISLNPALNQEPKNDYHGFEMLGAVDIDDIETVNLLVKTFKSGVEEHDGSVADCFNPRHGIKFTVDGQLFEFVICFECLQVKWKIDGKDQKGFLISASPQLIFDRILTDAGVELAPPS